MKKHIAPVNEMIVHGCNVLKKEKQVFDTANRVEKLISEQGFEVRRLKKSEIKRFLALFFDASLSGEAMPDLDGAQFFGEDIRE